MLYQSSFQVATQGRGSYSISRDITQRLEESRIRAGICLIFLHHTSASLILCENADPQVPQIWKHRQAAQRRRVTLTVYGE